jgi:DNA-binding CsgD family transcriptional regulator
MKKRMSWGGILSSIYDAAATNTAWPACAGAIAEVFEARACGVAGFDFKWQKGEYYFSSGIEQRFLESYRATAAPQDPWHGLRDLGEAAGAVRVVEEVVGEERLLRSAFYRDWLRPQKLFRRLSAVLIRDGSYVCELMILRARDDPPFGLAEQQSCRMLEPHLRRAILVGRRLGLLQTQQAAILEVLDRLATGVAICDDSGKLLFANQAARETLDRGEALALRGGRVVARDQQAMSRLLRLLGPHPEGHQAAGVLLAPRSSSPRPLHLLVAPVRPSHDPSPGPERLTSIIFIHDPDGDLDDAVPQLRELYGLTPSECRLATSLAEGATIDETAAAVGLTTETARTYLKRILSKTGVRRQTELVRLLLRAALPVRPSPPPHPSQDPPPSEAAQIIGRRAPRSPPPASARGYRDQSRSTSS